MAFFSMPCGSVAIRCRVDIRKSLFMRLMFNRARRNIGSCATAKSTSCWEESLSLFHDDVHTEILFEDRYLVVAGAASPWARRRKITLAELVNEPWIDMPQTSILAAFSRQHSSPRFAVPRKSVLSFSHHLRHELLATEILTIVAGWGWRQGRALEPQGPSSRPDNSPTLCRCFHLEATKRHPVVEFPSSSCVRYNEGWVDLQLT